MELSVYVGFDARERKGWEVTVRSLQARTGDYPVSIHAISRPLLEESGLYTRPTEMRDGRRFDVVSGEYCSTDFSLARFWVRELAGRVGWALFCDCDFLWRADVRELLNFADPRKAMMVVPHDHRPGEDGKMDGQVQTRYPRKNWSSLMLWNLGHAAHLRLTRQDLNTRPKHWLHGLSWLKDEEIGFLPEAWNWLEGWSSIDIEPRAVHFTRGTPDMPGYEHSAYAREWWFWLGGREEAGDPPCAPAR